ncbi:MAG: VOC family protein [Bacillus sp. (in: Bacteria)]|nr:VOC family protein [Bacillus sp. (in: firmicutes)]
MEKQFFQAPSVYVGEVVIQVTDLQRSLQFYREIVGFQYVDQTERKAILSADGKTPLLILVQPEGVTEKEERKTGLYHFAILLPSRDDLSSFLRHLVEKGVPIGASDHLVSEALYFSDPDGNGIEVYRDREASQWGWQEGKVAMATLPLDGKGLLAVSDEKWSTLPTGTIIGHIHLHVSDLEKTEAFYLEGLGFDLVTRYPGALFMSTNGYHHHIGANVWNGVGAPPPSESSVGLRWFTLEFPSEESLEETVNTLQKIGAPVEEKDDGFFTADPSQNRIYMRVK